MERILRPDRFDADPHSSDASDLWIHWKKTLDNYLNSIDSLNADKLATLTNLVSPSVYKHIVDCTDFDSAIQTLTHLFIQPKNEIFARHVLSTARQESGQTLDQFLQKLKSFAVDCNFKAVTADVYRDESIRDSFIRGLLSAEIRQRLLEKKELDLKTAFDLAKQLELAHKQSLSYNRDPSVCFSVKSPELTAQIPLYSETPTDTVSAATGQSCYFCGFSRHPRTRCPAREASCKTCGKRGHFQRVCRAAASSNRVINRITPVTDSVLSTITVAASPSCLFNAVTQIHVNGVSLHALIDTGSSESYISKAVVQKFKWPIEQSRQRVTMASTRLSSTTLGHCFVSIIYKNMHYKSIKLSILSDLCTDVLLGHDFLKLHTRVEIPFPGDKPAFSLCGLLAARVEPQSLFQHLSPDCKPVATKSRRHNPQDEIFIRSEIKQLLDSGIIEPSKSPWRAQVLVTSNERHKRRMVIDYSQTINRFTYLDAYPFPRIDDLITKIANSTVFSTLDLKSAYHQIPIKSEEKKYTAFEACNSLYQFCRIPFGVTNGVACFQRTIDDIISKEKLLKTFAYLDNLTICGDDDEDHDQNLNKFLEVANKYGITFNKDKSVIRVRKVNILGYEISKGVIRPDPERLKPLETLPAPQNLKAQERVVGMFAYYSRWISHFSDKIHPLIQNRTFPLPTQILTTFDNLKRELVDAAVITIEPGVTLVVETDASDIAIAASLNQNGRPVAFFSRTLSPSEHRHSAIEKEAYAIVEALKKWRHFLIGNHFKLITDQRSVAFMFGSEQRGKIKNEKIQRWRVELSSFQYDVVYRPGRDNPVADTLSRGFCATISNRVNLYDLHSSLCHPGVTRMIHFVRSRNLPFSAQEVKEMTSRCRICAEVKARFFNPPHVPLIKATQPFERLSIDFKGPLPSASQNKFLLTIVDEFSRFPFAYPCSDISTPTVIKCLTHLFAIFGMPAYIHSDRGASFMSEDLCTFLHTKGVATSHTTAYNPQSNGQVERLNGTIWKAITLSLKSRELDTRQWEAVLLDALHSIRSLLCTATNVTPHERLFTYNRRATSGTSLPSWLLTSDRVLLKKNNRRSKYDPIVEEVELLECNPSYARVRLPDGREDTVSLRQLAPSALENDPLTENFKSIIESEANPQIVVPNHSLSDEDITEEQTADASGSDHTAESNSTEDLIRMQQRVRPYLLRNREA